MCVGVILGTLCIEYLVEADPVWNFASLTSEQFEPGILESKGRYKDILGMRDPDLTSFYLSRLPNAVHRPKSIWPS
jgi:hypothetical protein